MSINVDFINGYLEAMRCLNMGPNHGCYFSIVLLEHRGNLSNTLKQHFGTLVDSKGKHYDGDLWHINPVQITVEKFTQIISEWFFKLSYAPTIHKENNIWGIRGFIDALAPVKLDSCYLYEIHISPPISYATRWCDLVIIYQNEHYLIHFDFDS
ncbi:hypothetical protein [Snodgrassella communis]|uniref:hypothetical protein n=1 Tax=Snodgrassella communis TaxID=2946699 RepID=UPI001EF6F9A0|nr:hypothetical protein [Snodgrassella communis]